jgi:hypothetical protein
MPDNGNGDALKHVLATFDRWLILENRTPLYAILGAIAANYMDGDPVWLGIIAPPSSAKTEILNALTKLRSVHTVATLTPAGLLSGTPTKDRKNGAKGGLLRDVGKFGIVVLKDFGSILTLRPDTKAEVIAALREVYDGVWTRVLGTEGGQKLHWAGKVGMVFAATQAYDDHTSINAGLGERNLLVRLGNGHAGKQFHMALRHTGGAAKTMREELSEAVRVLFELPMADAPPLSDSETKHLESIVTKIVRLRATVVRDWRTREIENIHAPEGPGRITIALAQLRAGLCGIGLDPQIALDVVEKVAFDTAPPMRVAAFSFLSPNKCTTRELAIKMGLPTNTVRRVLEDLMCQGLAERHRELDPFGEEKQGGADLWTIQYPN